MLATITQNGYPGLSNGQVRQQSISKPHDFSLQGRHRVSATVKVFRSKALLKLILSYTPIEALVVSSRINHDWYLIIKYMLPVSLINLRMLCMGELVYWLPGENRFPKTVLLKLKLSAGVPKFIQISTSLRSSLSTHTSSSQRQGNNQQPVSEIVGTSGHYQMLELSEILFIIDGHWTPIFATLNQQSAQETFDMDASQFFHRSKCFSIVTNTYMTYDFIAFNAQSNTCAVNTLRSIIHQSHELSSKMAIHAKANKKYSDALNQTPLIFKDTLSALNFEMFVLILQDCINKIGAEWSVDIPSVITTQANASLLYPLIIEERVGFARWHAWCRAHIIGTLREHAILDPNESELAAVTGAAINGTEAGGDASSGEEEKRDAASHTASHGRRRSHSRTSSLFGVKAFPMDEDYDLFAAIPSSDEEEYEYKNQNSRMNRKNGSDESQEQCLIM